MMEKKLYVSDVLFNTFAAAHKLAIHLLIERSIKSAFSFLMIWVVPKALIASLCDNI